MLAFSRRLAVFLLTFSLTACASYEDRDPVPTDFPIHGIDISRWQGDIDWHKVRKAGTEFAFLKATEGGDHLDPKFIENWNGAKAAGVPRGAYHFYFFCRPVEDQIAWFIQNVPVDPTALPPVLDMEWNGESSCRVRPPRGKIIADMTLFLDTLQAHYGKRPIVYTTVDFHREILVGHFTAHDFWIRSVARHPIHMYSKRDDWVFWQYTAEGRVPGIKGDVDRNVFFGTKRQWQQWLRGELPNP